MLYLIAQKTFDKNNIKGMGQAVVEKSRYDSLIRFMTQTHILPFDLFDGQDSTMYKSIKVHRNMCMNLLKISKINMEFVEVYIIL